jgi:hypothetical protein
LKLILNLHEKLHGNGASRIRCAERRDAAMPRDVVPTKLGLETDASFGRKREAAVAEVMGASPSKRARMIGKAPLGLRRLAQEAVEEGEHNYVAASAAVIAKVDKHAGVARERDFRGAVAAAKARAKREKKVVQTKTQPPKGFDQHMAPILKAGSMLVRLKDREARCKGQRLRFSLASDPLEFVAQVLKVPASMKKGHVVIAPPADTDYSLSAMIAAALLGCFYAAPKEFRNQDESPSGIMYTQAYKNQKQSFHVAVSAALADEFPTLPRVFTDIAQAPGSCFKYYLSERKLCKASKRTKKTTPRLQQRMCVLSTRADREGAEAKYRHLYISPRDFLLKFRASERAVCPGCQPT